MSVTIDNKRADRKIALEEPDYQYYNIRLEGTSTTPGRPSYNQAIFKENRTVPILDKPSDYEIAIVRFSVPALNIPIFIWEPLKYSITLSFDGQDETEFLIFVPNTTTPDIYGEAVWNYSELIQFINTALDLAFTNLKIAKPLAPPTQAPFLVFNPATQLISLYAQTLYAGAGTINIYFNGDLLNIMPSFQTLRTIDDPNDQKAFQVLVLDRKTNTTTYAGTPYFITDQDYPSLFLWNDFKSILFETDSIPVEPEYQPAQNNVTRRIVTDFEPLSDVDNRQAFQFFPQGPLRYYDLKSDYPMRTIDLQVFWEDRNGRTYPIFLGDDDLLTCKLLFRRKKHILFSEFSA